MNMNRQEVTAFLAAFGRLYDPIPGVGAVICPPYVWLDLVVQNVPAGVEVGAQNLHEQAKGAFTGEISAAMLKDTGCRYVIIGHSERRQWMGENDPLIRAKIMQALQGGLFPLVCVGENERQRKAGQAQDTVLSQLRGALDGVAFQPGELVIAYEPVWAIGTGNTASSADAQEMAVTIRHGLEEMLGDETAARTLILYGGSVTPDNAADLLGESDVDGALVGGASLDPVKFWSIIACGRSL